MRDVLRKWTQREKLCQVSIKISRHILVCSLISQECSGEISRQSVNSVYPPYKFAQRGCIPPKIKCKILAC